MQNVSRRAHTRILTTVAFTSLVLLSFSVTALMQSAHDRTANRRPGGSQPNWRIPLNLALAPNNPDAQVLLDGGFEGGNPWTSWTVQTSTNFGSSICNTTICSTNGGLTSPQSGTNWLWYGGGTGGLVEDSTTGQSVTIPNTGSAVLVFFMKIQQVNTPFTDTMAVQVDGVTQQTFTEPIAGELTYTKRIVNLSAFANGASHSVVLVYHSIDGATNFLIDDLFLTSPSAADAAVQGRITDTNGAPLAGTVVQMNGTQNRKTITDGNGNYRFAEVETNGFYTLRPSRANYSFNPIERSFSQLGNRTEAVFTGSPVAGENPLDTPEYFVRQQYLDFLGREPDEAGLNFWSDQIIGCGGDSSCLDRRTVNVSAAYFLSIESRQTGGLVDSLYQVSYGRAPLFSEFVPDRATISHDLIVNQPGWQEQLRNNKEDFLEAWAQRPAFRAAYDNLGNDGFVDTLISNTGVDFAAAEREALVSGLNNSTLTRVQVLQRVAENEGFVRANFNEAFVRMQYFGYLRRDPDNSGFHFWLNKLNEFNGNFEQAEMVKAFIVSGEYRDRFPH